jgi:hypothetical protein
MSHLFDRIFQDSNYLKFPEFLLIKRLFMIMKAFQFKECLYLKSFIIVYMV